MCPCTISRADAACGVLCADNTALGAMMMHAKAAPQSASPSYLKSHFTTDVLQYVSQPGHTTPGALKLCFKCKCVMLL